MELEEAEEREEGAASGAATRFIDQDKQTELFGRTFAGEGEFVQWYCERLKQQEEKTRLVAGYGELQQ